MEITKKQKWIFFALMGAWFVYALLFTPSGDDWERIAFSPKMLGELFAIIPDQYLNLNGRVIGNFLSFALMKPLWLRALLKVLCIGAITVSMFKLAGLRSFAGLVLTLVMVTVLPLNIHVQAYVWSAGFFNYVIPIAIVLPFLVRWRRGEKKVPIPAAFFTGFIACFFVEHVTLVLFIAAGAILVALAKSKEKDSVLLSFAIGILLGTLLMAGSPVYHDVAIGADWYRRVPTDPGSFEAQLFKNFRRFGPFILAWQVIPLLVLVPGVLNLLLKKGKRAALVIWCLLCAAVAFLFIPFDGYSIFVLEIFMGSWWMIALYLAVHFLLWGFLVWQVTPLLPATDRNNFLCGLVLWLLLYAPLTVVHPIGPRNYYAGTLALAFVCLVLVKALSLEKADLLGVAATAILCGTLLWRGGVHYANTRVQIERDAVIKEAMQRKETAIQVPRFPYPYYVHGNQTEGLQFYYYEKEPGDVDFFVEERFRKDVVPKSR